MSKWLFLLLTTFIGSMSLSGQTRILASDFGVKPNSFTNAAPFIRKAIESCAGRSGIILQLPAGRIDMWPDGAFKKELYISNSTENDTLSKVKNIAFLLEGFKNISIEGNNTLIMLHGKMESFAFLNCSDIVLKNISFDYECPTMSELKITSVTNNEVKTEIHPDTRFFPKTNFQVGNIFTIRDPYRDNSGAFISLSKNIRLENVKMHYMHDQTYGFKAFFAGDSIAFINPQTLQPVANAVIKGATLLNRREMELELAQALPKGVETVQVIENITWTPEVRISNSRFEKTNTRGLLITTRRKVLIENNTFYRTGMHAILIANDASSWFESGPVQDVTIRNNTFEECAYDQAPGNYVIAIAPENHKLIPGYMVHRNIRIENNIFKVYDYPILTARSTENLIFRNNIIVRTDFKKISDTKRSQFKSK